MNIMHYKGYPARVEYSADDACFVGRVMGIRDVIGFRGESVAALERDFHQAVDFYLETCGKRGKAPEVAYADDRQVLRVPQDLLNDIISDALQTALEVAGVAAGAGKKATSGKRKPAPSKRATSRGKKKIAGKAMA